MDLSPAHLHLILNHFPTVGFIVGLGLFVVGVAARSDHLKVASLVTLIGIALLTIPIYVTGAAAADALCTSTNVPGPCRDATMSRALVEMHEGAAFLSLGFMELAGGLAWLALWQHRRFSRMSAWTIAAILALSFVTVATAARAATLGGEIRHAEIRVTPEAAAPQLGRVVGGFISRTPWTWIASETLHFIGLTLLVGVVLLIDLRMLGLLPSIGYSALDRLLPWAILGFGLNVVTGMLFFAAAPYQYVGNSAFYWKLAFGLAAGANTLWFTFDPTWTRDRSRAPVHSRLLAMSALVLWVGVMYWGSMLPFIGQAF
jgi:uncharacterized membrane protein